LKFHFFNGDIKELEVNGLSSHTNEEKLAEIFNRKKSDWNFDLKVEVIWKDNNKILETKNFENLNYVCNLDGEHKCGFAIQKKN